jgi:hypothetical protein
MWFPSGNSNFRKETNYWLPKGYLYNYSEIGPFLGQIKRLLSKITLSEGGKSMDAVKEPYVANFKNVLVKVSDGTLLRGKVNIGENYHRLSDMFRHSNDSFIVLVAEESPENTKKVFFINKTYIIWAEAQD